MEKYRLGKRLTKRQFRAMDAILVVLFVLICLVLLKILFTQLRLKHEVSEAEQVTNQVIIDISKLKAADVYRLSEPSFQKDNSIAELSQAFQALAQKTHGTAQIDKQIVTNYPTSQNVSVIYKFPDKPTFYIRVIVTKPKGATSWKLIRLSGNTDEHILVTT